MIVDQLFPQKLNESLADQIMQSARAAGLNPRLRGTPEQERERTQQMLAQRAQEREQQSQQAAMDDARNLMALKTEYKQMKDRYESLGGSNWQYADREQNLSDGEREARSMEPALNRLRARIAAAEQVITKENITEMDKSQKGAPGWNISDNPGGKEYYGKPAKATDVVKKAGKALDKAFDKAHSKKKVKESRLNEAMLLEDPVYRNFKTVGRYIAERKMSEKEILQVFADAEAGMTDKATGANRTFLGRGKDTATDFAGGVADALKGVWSGIQNSVPVAAVDVAYDQATDALAGLTGGQKGQVMQAIKKYRNLAKQYPKTAGLAKGALVAITGLATGGAGLPAVAALIYGLDSAIKGEKLSDIALKAGGAAATAWAGQKIASAFGGDQAAGEVSASDSLAPGEEIVPSGAAPGAAAPGAEGFGGGTYTVQAGDQGGYIAQAQGIPFKELEGLNPQITDWNKLPVGAELQLPPTGDNVGSVWRDLSAAPGASTTTAPAAATPTVAPTAASASPYGAVRGPMGLDYTSIAGIPVVPGQPLNATQMAVADFAMQQGNKLSPVVQAAYDLAKRGAVRESVKFKKLPVDKLIDQKTTVLSWALSESVGRKSHSVNLTTVGTYTVFENVDRYRRAILSELKGVPGSTRPNYYRPDMPGAPAPTKAPKKQGWFGKGLDYLDKAAGKVGGALSNFGHQFTTNVTKEKLKMNWHQAGKPSDSDQLAAWLVKQGVPQDVVSSVYGSMGIPYTAATPAATTPAATTPAATPAAAGGAQKELAFYGTNPKTGKPWTVDQLKARQKEKVQAAMASIPAGPGIPVNPNATPAPPNFGSPAVNQVPMTGFNASNVMDLPGMSKYKKPAPAKTPNFAGPGGYKSVTTSFKPTVATTPAAPATTPAKPKVVAGGPTPDEQAKLAQRIAQAAKQPVAEMLAMVETKEDVARIKQFIDQTFVKYGAVSESAFVVRNQLIEHVTQVGAQRRREFARKS